MRWLEAKARTEKMLRDGDDPAAENKMLDPAAAGIEDKGNDAPPPDPDTGEDDTGGDDDTPPTLEEMMAEWTGDRGLKSDPASYIELHPEGQHADLAGRIVAARAAADADG